jgi:hypothetical protein
MNFSYSNRLKKSGFLFLFLAIVLITACHRRIPKQVVAKPAKPLTFKSIIGIHFTEVRRRLGSGRSFSDNGYQAVPSYQITFLKNDSASIYSPNRKAFLNFLVFVEQDSIFDVAHSFFKLKFMSRDSMVLQVLKVVSDTLRSKQSLIYMTFYADDYIKNVLHTTAQALQKPDRRDTLFIKQRTALADKIPDSAFAAPQPAVLKSISPNLTVSKEKVKADVSNNFDASENYMNPQYDITITKAYEDFSYPIYAIVDTKGQIIFYHSINYIEPEYRETTIKTIKGIIDGYLKAYMTVTPGTSLGIKHASWVLLNLVGKK